MDIEHPRNADRAEWGAAALARFANLMGLDEDLLTDPETVLADLLADLMHWCDAERDNHHREETIDFRSALWRARRHYRVEFDNEANKL